MANSAIATAADYADAMMSARRARNWLFVLLLLTLLAQLAIFPLVRFGQIKVRQPAPQVTILPASQPATQPAVVVTPTTSTEAWTNTGLRYVTGLTTFLGLILVALLAVVLLLIMLIMLVGRLIGVSRLTSAFIWCVVLGFMLFPWQAFLNWRQLDNSISIPGVLYTYQELTAPRVTDPSRDVYEQVVLWSRFTAFPAVALILLLVIQAKATRGLRLALGEAEVTQEETPTP